MEDHLDEIMSFWVLSVHAQSELRAELSPEVSCTDASPSGGGSAVATKFKEKSLDLAAAKERSDSCGHCRRALFSYGRDERTYACPLECGERFCSAVCVCRHTQGGCIRGDFYCPRFGERFSGPNYPLTKACALAGIAIQRPMDIKLQEDPWDILSAEGKAELEDAECDPSLKATHWAPECRTFSRSRGRWIELPNGEWIQGPRQVRSDDEPWGFQGLTRSDQVVVRQGNTYMKQSLKGLRTRHQAGGFASLEHPYNSYIWETPEINEMRSEGHWFESVYSHCCFGGERVKWTRLFHNCPHLHQALHKPHCSGHQNLRGYFVTLDREGQLQFDTAQEAEYPWGFCLAYAQGLRAQLKELTPEPYGDYPVSLEALIYGQVRGATKGLQNEAYVNQVVAAVTHCLKGMHEGNEEAHLSSLMRQVGLRGTDVRISVPNSEADREQVLPYPAFRWLWKTVLSYRWHHEQHINILEVTAVLTEFRRRLRSSHNIHKRFFNIVDSMVTYFALTKGRSGSRRLNRPLRRVMALNVASKSVLVTVWTLSKWNFADGPSRKFEK